MVSKTVLAFAASAWLMAAWSTGASAGTSIEDFRTFCLAKDPKPETIAAVALNLGYKPMPAEAAAKAGYHYGQMQAFTLPNDSKRATLILGVDDFAPGLQMTTCVFIHEVDASDDPTASMEALLQVGPPLDLSPKKLFLFTDDDGVLRRATPSADLADMATKAQGKLRMALAARSGEAAILQVLALVPASK